MGQDIAALEAEASSPQEAKARELGLDPLFSPEQRPHTAAAFAAAPRFILLDFRCAAASVSSRQDDGCLCCTERKLRVHERGSFSRAASSCCKSKGRPSILDLGGTEVSASFCYRTSNVRLACSCCCQCSPRAPKTLSSSRPQPAAGVCAARRINSSNGQILCSGHVRTLREPRWGGGGGVRVCRQVHGLDATSAQTFGTLWTMLDRLGVELVITHLDNPDMERLLRAHGVIDDHACACVAPTSPRSPSIDVHPLPIGDPMGQSCNVFRCLELAPSCRLGCHEQQRACMAGVFACISSSASVDRRSLANR